MPQSTPNLSLVTYDLTLDAGVYFSTFRTTLAGYTNSALTKIDTWAGQVNADLATLKQSPSIIRVSATKDSDFIYSATVANMTQYSLNQYINLSLSADNVGTVSLNINALGGKSLLKFNNAGTLVNISAKDLRQNKNNLFTYNGTAWVWVNAISSDQLNIAGTSGNLVKISTDNTLEDSGATFSNAITNNAIVQRTATGQIKGAVASANDDVVNKLYADTIDNKIGLLSALETVDKTNVVGAINENFGHIGDLSTLTTTDKSNLVGATNELNSAIGQIANDRGYVVSKQITDCNSAIVNGKYVIYNGANQPLSGASTWFIDVNRDIGSSLVAQKAVCVFGAKGSFCRIGDGTTFTSWVEVATETNTLIVKNVPAGVTKIENLPMGLYRIWTGSQVFSDYPPLAKKMSHEYGILRVVSDNANYKTYSLIGVDANGLHSAEYTGFSATEGESTAIKWSGAIPYSVNATGGVTIISQNNYILNGVMYINLTVRKTDSSNFVAGVQYGIAGCPNLILTYPKNVSFTGWDLAGSVLIGSGGVGTIFVNTVLYIIPTAACGVLRITGEFLIE